MANRFTFPRETALDANGSPLSGAKLYFYEAGTTNPADSFADEALTVANTNPVVADSAGRFGDIFLRATDYKVILKDAADVTIWTADPVAGTIDATGDKFIPSQQSPADMTVLVGPGTIWDAVAKTRRVLAAQTTALIVAPVTNPRNDIVYIDRVTGAVDVQAGAEAVSPTDPPIPDGKLPVARVRLATTTIEITSTLIDDIRDLELLGAGSVATRNTGVADGQVPLMDATGYPAADGSRLTNVDVPRGYIDGLILSNNATDAAHDIDIAPGIARDQGNAANMDISATLTKQIDAPWAVGLNAGGLEANQIDGAATVTFTDNGASNDFVTIDSGTWATTPSVGDTLIVTGGVNAGTYQITAATTTRIDVATGSFAADAGSASEIRHVKIDTWYHIWLIRRSDTGVVDALFSESATTPTLPENYDQQRRTGAVLTDGSANIVGFSQVGEQFFWNVPVTDYNVGVGAGGTTRTLHTLSVPTGLKIQPISTHLQRGNTGGIVFSIVTDPDSADLVPTGTTASAGTNGGAINGTVISIQTNISAQIGIRTDSTNRAVSGLTFGWIDPRGRNS